MATDKIDAAHARIMRDALETIAAWPVNGSSEPDRLAVAIEAIQDLAQAALGSATRKNLDQWLARGGF
jgi:hypothetical protein